MAQLPARSARLARPVRRRAGVAAVVLVAMVGLSACRTPPDILTVTPVVTGLENPWDLAFLPSGDLVFTERVGRIDVRIASTGTVRTLAAPADVLAAWEGGMLGIAVDPAFASNRRIYTCFQSNISGTVDVRLVRWRVNDATTGLTDRTDIVTGIPTVSGRHTGCRPRFGPDGNIWMGTGDAAVGTNPQSPTSLGGKVLRVDANGSGVVGNAPSPFDPRIYNYGHRNVQGIAFTTSGQAFSIEHGTDRDDEVNLLVAGANYGWDPVPPGGGAGYDESQPMTDLVKFPNAKVAVWSSGNPTIAPSGGTFLSGAQWGGWQRGLAMAVLKSQQLRVIGLDDTDTTFEQDWTAVTDKGRLRVAVEGPDGNLYLATDASPDGQILKVVPSMNPTP